MYATIEFILNFFEMSEAILRKSQVTASLFPFTRERSFMTSRSHPLKKSFHDFSFSPLSSCCDPGLLWETFLGGGQRQCDSWNCNKPIKGCLFSFKEILLLNSFKSSKRIGSWKSNSDSSCFRITLGPGLLQWIRFFLLGCSELSKARLVRFLSKETRWVALYWNIICHRLYILLRLSPSCNNSIFQLALAIHLGLRKPQVGNKCSMYRKTSSDR